MYFWGEDGSSARYLTPNTAKAGTQVVIPYRDEDEKRHLKVTGDLGQIVPLVRSIPSPICCVSIFDSDGRCFGKEWDIRNEEQIAECVRHSDIVYNIVGRDYETKYVHRRVSLYAMRC